ncbi:MAG: hypothetical protein ACMG6S_13530 [Byssovorax sp.]
MAHRYADAGAFKRALEDRLKRRAQDTGEDLERLRQRAVFERLLARIVAHFGDRVIVKGGVALQLRSEGARGRGGEALREAIHATFTQRGSHEVPPSIVAPPDRWSAPYADMVKENSLRWTTLDELTTAVRAFLDPVLRGEDGTWDPPSWSWRRSA